MDYEKIDAIRWSQLKYMRTSPLAYKHALESPFTGSDLTRIGTCIHAYVLEPDTFDERFVVYEDRRQGKKWDAFKAEHEAAGKEILSRSEYDRAIGAGRSVLSSPIAMQYLEHGIKESVVTWTDPGTGLRMKAKPDNASRWLVELKSTAVIEPERFPAQVARMGYHGQCGVYIDGLRANGIEVEDEAIIPAVQSEPPFDCVVYRLEPHVIDEGRRLYKSLLERVAECMERDNWPGIAQDVVPLDLPTWAYTDDDLGLTMGGESLEVA